MKAHFEGQVDVDGNNTVDVDGNNKDNVDGNDNVDVDSTGLSGSLSGGRQSQKSR